MIFFFPTYNNYNSLKKFLNFAKSDEKIIVSDNSDNDEIKFFCNRYPNIIFFKKKPANAVSNWNFGLSKISNEFIIIIHDDDFISKEFYEYIKTIKLDKNTVYLQNYAVYKSNKRINLSFTNFLKKFWLNYFPKLVLYFNFIGPTASYIFYIKEMKYYDNQFRWKLDIEYFYRISRNKNFVFLPFVVKTHIKPYSITSNLKNNFLQIEFQEAYLIKKKYHIGLFEFILYFCFSIIFRAIKRLFTLFL